MVVWVLRVQCAAAGPRSRFARGYLDRRDQLVVSVVLDVLLGRLVQRLRDTVLRDRSGGARRCRKQPRAWKHNEEDGLQRGNELLFSAP